MRHPAASAPVVDGELPHPPPNSTSNNQPLFKRHKTLPHPRKDSPDGSLHVPHLRAVRKERQGVPLTTTASSSSGGSSTDETCASHSKSTPKTMGNGPRLPPTPPAHSRNSSSTYSALPSMTTYAQSPDQSAEDIQRKTSALPTTPTQQMSPPTPDVTPPQALQLDIRPKGQPQRLLLRDQSMSKGTDSRAESFKTAREDLSSSSDDEAALGRLRPAPDSAKILPESTLRQLTNGDAQPAKKRPARPVGLGLGLESSPGSSLASSQQSRRHFKSFDGEWGAAADELAEKQDGNPSTRVVRQTHQRPRRNATEPAQVVEDFIVPPTNATKAARSISLPQRILTFPTPNEGGPRSVSDDPQSKRQQPRSKKPATHRPQDHLAIAAPVLASMEPSADPLASDKVKRSSTASSRSTVSTVVEAVVVGTPPQRQRTLRHVRARAGLRDSGLDLSPTSSGTTSLADETARKRRPEERPQSQSTAHENRLSSATCNSLSSRSARREIWKAGGIPVVVVPSRMSSAASTSRTPSLRSTSSRRSKRTQSVHSVPISHTSSRRGRTLSETRGPLRDGSARGDQRTMDYPPIVPRRTSSLSAPTSRNGSRSTSFTADSIHACAAIRSSRTEQQKTALAADTLDNGSQASSEARTEKSSHKAQPSQASQPARYELFPKIKPIQITPSTTPKMRASIGPVDADNLDSRTLTLLDPPSSPSRHDRNASTHLSPNTPFSVVSVETATSHHSQTEVSEALAVNIYSHQNTSVFVVNHSSRPSNCSDDSRQDQSTDHTEASTPVPESGPVVVLSPFSAGSRPKPASGRGMVNDGVAVPSMNPKTPPPPPAIDFTPATPSGMTPPNERSPRQEAIFADEDAPDRSGRRNVAGVLRRALSRGRSLTRSHGPVAGDSTTKEYGPSASRSAGLLNKTLSMTRDMQRRARSIRRSDSVDRGKGIAFDDEPVEEDKLHPFWQPSDANDHGTAYRYPPIDNRYYPPSRSLSLRMKETFAILPLDPEAKTERRTVRRTPSGNLRVVKHFSLAESLRPRSGPPAEDQQRPYTAPGDQGSKPRVWRSLSLSRGKSRVRDHSVEDGEHATEGVKRTRTLPSIGDKLGEFGPHTLTRRFSERRRERRINELRRIISAPQEVRDGVGEVIRRTNYRDAFTQAQRN